jgi:hypothetical protein
MDPQPAGEKASPTVVRTLLCHSHVDMALSCLGSMRTGSREPFRLVVHDDGTLDDADRERLRTDLAVESFVSRREADERMAVVLAKHPHAAAYRRRQVYGLKLFDVPLLADEATITMIDSDILFIRPFSGLFAWEEEGARARFMQDIWHAYSVRPWRIGWAVALPSRVNVGLVQLRRADYDLDFIDHFLGNEKNFALPNFVEQTAWAALGQRIGCTKVDPRQLMVMHAGLEADHQLAGIHFVSPQRNRLPEYRDRLAGAIGQPAVQLRSVPAGRCSAMEMLGERLKHKLFKDA